MAGIVALTLATRPYAGIWHDARLYTVQALRLLQPENYANDLFFLFGSQDNYTLFTNIYAHIISWFGVPHAAMALLLIGQAAWGISAYLLLRKLLPSPLHWLTLAAALTILGYYSEDHIFMVRESFVTPRIYAESLVLLSLTFFFSRRYTLTGLLLLASLLLHPLVALPVLIFIFFWLLMHQPRTALIIGAGSLTIVLMLALAGISPAKNLLVPIDAQWFTLTSSRTPQVYTSSWGSAYWNGILILLSFLLYASSRLKDATLRTTSLTILLSTVTALFITWLATETRMSVLVVQLQLWRILWLTQFLALAIAALMLWHAQKKRETTLPLLGFATALFYLDSIGGIIAIAVCIVFLYRDKIKLDSKWLLLLISAIFLLGAIEYISLLAIYLYNSLPVQIAHSHFLSESPNFSNSILRFGVISIATACIFVIALTRTTATKVSAAILSIAISVLTVTLWDIRSPSAKQLIKTNENTQQLRSLIKPNETVFWGDNSYLTWFLLNRSSYYSIAQSAGIIFNRELAIEAQRRHNLLSTLYEEDNSLLSRSGHGAFKEPPLLSEKNLIEACEDPKLDWLALNHPFSGTRAEFEYNEQRKWYFYKCSDFRLRHTVKNE